MNEYDSKQIVEQLKELNKKKFKTEVNFGIFWTMGYLFSLGFVPDLFLGIEKMGFWSTISFLILSFLLWPISVGEHLNSLIQLIGK